MQFSSADLDALLEGEATVTCGGDPSAKGTFRIADVEVEVEGGMTATASHPTILVRSDRLPSAVRHATVTVDGTDYVVRDSRLESNGQLKRLILVGNDQ